MSEEIRNLACKPILSFQGPATPEELKHIKDVRIVYTLPAIERTRATRHTFRVLCYWCISASVALFNGGVFHMTSVSRWLFLCMWG